VVGLSIGDVARRAGMSTSAIRYYERIGILPKPPRASGQRRYDASILERLAMVRFARRVGFTVGEITVLLNGSPGRPPPEKWRRLAHDKVAEVDQLIAQASTVRRLLLDTLDQKCPKLVERGASLTNAPGTDPRLPKSGLRQEAAAPPSHPVKPRKHQEHR